MSDSKGFEWRPYQEEPSPLAKECCEPSDLAKIMRAQMVSNDIVAAHAAAALEHAKALIKAHPPVETRTEGFGLEAAAAIIDHIPEGRPK